jgi:hypothetical protein
MTTTFNKIYDDRMTLEEFLDEEDLLGEIRNSKNANKLNIL